MAHAASHFAVSYPNHRILSSLLDLIVISRLASDAERAGAERFLTEVGVSDLVHRITTRAAALVDDQHIVVGRPGGRPLDVALRRAYDRPDLDKVATKLAKTFGMPLASRMRVFRNWVAPSEEFLERGATPHAVDRVNQVVRRLRLRRAGADRQQQETPGTRARVSRCAELGQLVVLGPRKSFKEPPSKSLFGVPARVKSATEPSSVMAGVS